MKPPGAQAEALRPAARTRRQGLSLQAVRQLRQAPGGSSGAGSSGRPASGEESGKRGGPPGALPPPLTIPGRSSVHGGRLVALCSLGVLGEGRLLVAVHRRAWVGGVGRAGVQSGVHVVLDEVVHSGLVALVGQGGQHALQRAPRFGFLSPPPPFNKDTRALAHPGPLTQEKTEKKLKAMAARAESAPTSTYSGLVAAH